MYLAPDSNNKPDSSVREVQSMLNAIRIRYHHSWTYLTEDGIYGKNTASAVKAFQIWRNLSSVESGNGVVLGDSSISKIKECYGTIPILTNPSPSTARFSENKYSIGQISLSVYNMGKGMTKSSIDTYEHAENFEKFLITVDEILSQQSSNLMRRISKIPKNARVRHLNDALEKAHKFIAKSKEFGVNEAAKITYGSLTKNDIIKYLEDCSHAISESPVTKFLKNSKNIVSKIKNALKPLYDKLNKIPGLKYLGAFEKIVRGISALFKCEFELSSKLFMDALREIVESLIVDAAVVAALAVGGWIALVLAIIVIVVFMVIDYLWFSDNPGESLADKHLGLKTQNVVQEKVAPWMYHKFNGL